MNVYAAAWQHSYSVIEIPWAHANEMIIQHDVTKQLGIRQADVANSSHWYHNPTKHIIARIVCTYLMSRQEANFVWLDNVVATDSNWYAWCCMQSPVAWLSDSMVTDTELVITLAEWFATGNIARWIGFMIYDTVDQHYMIVISQERRFPYTDPFALG